MEDGNIMDFDMCYLDNDLEPVTRARSNTWPMPRPEGYEDGPSIDGTAMSGSKECTKINLSTHLNSSGQAAGPPPIEKKTSRRNAWGTLSYAELISQAINSAKDQRLTLSQIYDWMVQNVPYFRDKGDCNSSAGWKNSIRHNLSLHNRFIRVQNESVGKSSWWMINQDAKLGKASRRRAASMEAGKYEKKRGRAKKQAETSRSGSLQTDIASTPSNSIGEGIDFFPGRPLYTNRALQSPGFRPRATSCASAYRRLSPIPAAPNEPEWMPENTHYPEQLINNIAKTIQLAEVYQLSQILPLDQQQVNFSSTHDLELDHGSTSTNLQKISDTHIIPLCPMHQLQSCNCEFNVFQINDTLSTYDQTGSYVSFETEKSGQCFETTNASQYNTIVSESTLLPIQETCDMNTVDVQIANQVINQTSNYSKLVRNNSTLDDIDEIIRREQYASVDVVNNSMSTTLYISNNNPSTSIDQRSWIH